MTDDTAYKNLRKDIRVWLDRLAEGLEPGRFRFCLEGSRVPVYGKQGLVSTCFAMRIALQTGIWTTWPDDVRKTCKNFVLSFQNPDGYFEDPWLRRASSRYCKDIIKFFIGKISLNELRGRHARNLMAETRQSAAILLMAGQKPRYPMPLAIRSRDDVRKFVESVDWRYPYTAGSHLSHQMVFLAINKTYFADCGDYESIVNEITWQLNNLCDSSTGTWFEGQTSNEQKLYGAMKVLSGLQWLGLECAEHKKILDFALKQPFEKEGCGFLNRVFVVYNCLPYVERDYRADEISDLARSALDEIFELRKPDGGFSFYRNRSQVNYYGAKISKGLPISDLHGTTMMCWAVGIIFNLLKHDFPKESGCWQISPT